MEKFLKSIFQSPPGQEKKKSKKHDAEEVDVDSPISDRRKLSMSRSGRLKHSYKKRHSLSMELYGENDMQPVEKPKAMEYHVHAPVAPREPQTVNTKSKSIDATTTIAQRHGSKSPEEEIDSAFEVIDKS